MNERRPVYRWIERTDGYGKSIIELVSQTSKDGDLFGSRIDKNRHLPCIDLDFPCELIESSTPGHFHLYLNKETTWENYKLLLDALLRCGYIEEGFHNQAIQAGQTFVRQPGVYKQYEKQYEMLKEQIEQTGEIFPSSSPGGATGDSAIACQ